jgi:RNA exonuclease 1
MFAGVTPKATADQQPQTPLPTPTVPAPPSAEELAPILSALNKHLAAVHAALPPRTALVIFTGHSDPRRMSLLNVRKSAFESALKSGRTPEEIRPLGLTWSATDGRDLEEAVELARRGLLFLGIKQ